LRPAVHITYLFAFRAAIGEVMRMNILRTLRIVSALLLLMAATRLNAVEITGHRGASYDAPENTLASMKLAWAQNADSIETDLWLSKDGKIVIIHDSDTKRMDGNTNKIATRTWDELRKVDVGSWKGSQFKGEPIPTLESILDSIPAGKRAVLEIKCGPEIAPELERVIRASKRPASQIAIISFKYDSLKESKARLPEIPHYFLYDYKTNAQGKLPKLETVIAEAKTGKFDGLDLQFKWPIDKAFVKKVKDAGLQLLVWTVNDPAVAKRLVEAGVDGITTDRPAWLREQLK
jgi:glycerophosphoryl diester phosphodiesterase